jgi:hypothetical protein
LSRVSTRSLIALLATQNRSESVCSLNASTRTSRSATQCAGFLVITLCIGRLIGLITSGPRTSMASDP